MEQGSQLAFENNFLFKETCCSERTNVSDAFQAIIEKTNLDMKIRQEFDDNKSIRINNCLTTRNNTSKKNKSNIMVFNKR